MESCWKDDSEESFTLFAAISQVNMSPAVCLGTCVGANRALPVISDTKQAMSEGKSGPVEARLTGLAATALLDAP